MAKNFVLMSVLMTLWAQAALAAIGEANGFGLRASAGVSALNPQAPITADLEGAVGQVAQADVGLHTPEGAAESIPRAPG